MCSHHRDQCTRRRGSMGQLCHTVGGVEGGREGGREGERYSVVLLFGLHYVIAYPSLLNIYLTLLCVIITLQGMKTECAMYKGKII